MTLLHIIQVDGTVQSAEYTGELEYKCPPFSLIKRHLDPVNDPEWCNVEHVSVLWKGKLGHMFVDEDGQRKGLRLNIRATRIYYNASFRELHPEWLYDDLSKDVALTGEEEWGFYIGGVAVLWEGELE